MMTRSSSILENSGAGPRVKDLPSPGGRSGSEAILRDCIDALLDLCEIWGYRSGLRRLCLQKTLRHWVSLLPSFEGQWMKLAKYKLASFFSSHMGQELPKRPKGLEALDNPGILLAGSGYRFLRAKLSHSTAGQCLGILASLKLSKKGMPRPSKEDCALKVRETMIHLTTPRPQPPLMRRGLGSPGLPAPDSWADVDEQIEQHGKWYVDRNEIELQIRRTVREVLTEAVHDPVPTGRMHWVRGGSENGSVKIISYDRVQRYRRFVEYSVSDRSRPLFPSINACYQNSVKFGGAAAFLQAHFQDYCKRKHIHLQHVPVRGGVYGKTGHYVAEMTMPELESLSFDFWRFCCRRAQKEVPMVKPVGLAEALKIRVITKGPAFTYFALKPLQKFLRERLSLFPSFLSLKVGGDLSAKQIQSVLGGSLKPGHQFLSGDYEAATDNLESWTSETAANELSKCLRLSKVERKLMLRALTHHQCEWEEPRSDSEWAAYLNTVDDPILYRKLVRMAPALRPGNLTRRWQRTGQLMGSIISFPILCIVNFAVCRMLMERDCGSQISLKTAPILINGDDVVFKCSPECRKYWSLVAGFVGLKESLGKTYFSDKFLEMNSRLTQFIPEELEELSFLSDENVKRFCHYRHTPLVNLGLAYGMKRSEGKVGVNEVFGSPREMTLGARHRELIAESGEWARGAHDLFVRKNKEMLTNVHVPWYVSERFGGLGMVPMEPKYPSELDVRLCRAIALNHVPVRSNAALSQEGWLYASQVLRETFGFLNRPLYYFEESSASAAVTHVSLIHFLVDNPTISRELGGYQGVYSKAEEEYLTKDDAPHPGLVTLRHNERMWRELLRGKYGFPKPCWSVNTDDGKVVYDDLADVQQFTVVGSPAKLGIPTVFLYQ